MNRLIATAACAVGILILFRLDRKHTSRTSIALLIPMAWLLIAGSRNVSEWFQMSGPVDAVDRYMEGNPLDRNVLSLLMLGGLITLAHRRQRAAALLKANLPIVAYFLYCGVSVLWSDYPLVGGKRWLRSLGDLIMVLVILTDSNWSHRGKESLDRGRIPAASNLSSLYPVLPGSGARVRSGWKPLLDGCGNW